VGALCLLGATTGVAGAAHHAGTVTKKAAAAQYLADDRPFGTARTTFQTDFTAWLVAHQPASGTTSFVTPFVTACRTFQDQLETQHWPTADKASVKAFAASLGVVADDVGGLPSVTAATGTAWGDKLKKDSLASVDAAEKLRKKLGLSASAG
jgi:hypothetical protein